MRTALSACHELHGLCIACQHSLAVVIPREALLHELPRVLSQNQDFIAMLRAVIERGRKCIGIIWWDHDASFAIHDGITGLARGNEWQGACRSFQSGFGE